MQSLLTKLEAAKDKASTQDMLAHLWGLNVGDDSWTEEAEKTLGSSNQTMQDISEVYANLELELQDRPVELATMRQRMERVFKAYYYSQHALYAQAMARLALQDVDAPAAREDDDDRDREDATSSSREKNPCVALSHFCPPTTDPKATSGYQKLLLYLLQQAYFNGYRRCGDQCYSRIQVQGGYDSHAWKPQCTIREFISRVTRKEYNFDYWAHLTRVKGNHESAIAYMSSCLDPQFPPLERDRHLFAFKTGLFNTKTLAFVPYGSPAAGALSTFTVACKYFDTTFEDHGGLQDWYHIPTPSLQHIMDTQAFPEEVCRWMYVFLGRMLFKLNDLDSWQTIPFFKGCAATGKSTILTQVVKRFFEADDVGVLSNNLERQFGLSAIADKFVFIAPEVRDSLGLDQAEFQSMVSGEDMTIARKHVTARAVEWSVPGIMAGNQVPSWRDTQGSILRRLVVFSFTKKPETLDMSLGKRLEVEMPNIIQKCARAYHEAIKMVGNRNVSKCLPDYFNETKEELRCDVDSVRSFLSSGTLRDDPALYMPMEEFIKLYNEYCRQNGFKPEKMVKQIYEMPLLQWSARVETNTLPWPIHSPCTYNKRWVVGLGMNDGAELSF